MGKLADPRGEAKRQCTLFAEPGARSAPFGTGGLANGAVPPKENEPSNINVSEQTFCQLKLFWMLLFGYINENSRNSIIIYIKSEATHETNMIWPATNEFLDSPLYTV